MSKAATSSCYGLRTQKLRSSCDGCGTAKTKCDRVQPTCGRCTEMNRECIYGISRRSGKPTRKRSGSRLDADSRQKRVILSAGKGMNSDIELGLTRTVNESEIDLSNQPNDMTWAFEANKMNQFELALPNILDGWDQFDNGLSSIGMITQSTDGQAMASASHTINSIAEESHSCARESYEIFRDLICPAPDLHAPESTDHTVSASLDQVLHCNRHAIDRLGRLLNCSCSRSGHRIMVHASILSRMLIWYQQAAGWTGYVSTKDKDSQRSTPPGSLDIDSPMGSSPLPKFTGFVVEHVPVSIGTFSVEDQNMQATFRYRMILNELKKTGKLIELFATLDYGSAFVGKALVEWLRSEYSQTVKLLMSRLEALEERSPLCSASVNSHQSY